MADGDSNSNAQSGPGSGSGGPDTQPPPPPQQGGGMNRVIEHMSANKIEAGLWLTRLFTVISTINFILPIFGGNQFSWYQRALISNAATSALRLHQRMPNFQFNREYFGQLFLEDSAHYLFYSLIFLNSYPATMVLVPVFLFAMLHATNYTKQLLDQLGPNSLQFVRNLVGKLEAHQRNILRFIACNEIFMVPMIIFMMFSGSASLLLPFVYYRFLTLRYASRRNPYCRQLFYELRVTVEHFIRRPQCPSFITNICDKAISFICRLAPEVVAQ